LLPPAALLAATLVVGRFLGSDILLDFFVAALAACVAVALSYLFSEDWRALMQSLVSRARVSRRRFDGEDVPTR
jgi:hypothetical protein